MLRWFVYSAVNWWLRSPDPSGSTNYRNVNSNGNGNSNNASNGNYLSFGSSPSASPWQTK